MAGHTQQSLADPTARRLLEIAEEIAVTKARVKELEAQFYDLMTARVRLSPLAASDEPTTTLSSTTSTVGDRVFSELARRPNVAIRLSEIVAVLAPASPESIRTAASRLAKDKASRVTKVGHGIYKYTPEAK